MSDNFMKEYYSWQNRFITAYNDAKTKPGFIKKMALNHPGVCDAQIDEEKLTFVVGRMKNYARKSPSRNGDLIYERTPRIDDIFAFCKAKGITPDEVFLNNLRDTVKHFSKFNSIFELIDKMEIGNYFFNIFSVERRDFDLQNSLPENLIFRIMFKRALIDNFKKFFVWDKGREVKYPLEFLGASESDGKEIQKLYIEILYYIKRHSDNSTIDYIFKHDDFKVFGIYGSDWRYSQKHGFSIGIETIYKRWSAKRHFMASIHYYILWSAVEAIQEMYKIKDEKDGILNETNCCLDFLEKNKDMFQFLEKLFLGTFIIINQSTIIDISGTIFEELELIQEEDDDGQDNYERRQDIPRNSKPVNATKGNDKNFEL